MPETEYQGLPIRKHSLAVRGASGDALSGVLKVKPQDFHAGVPIFVLMEVMPGPVRFDPMNEGDAWDHVQITKVVRGTIVDADVAVPLLDEVTVALEDLRVQETGQNAFDDIAVIADHNNGVHKRKRDYCPICQEDSDRAVALADEVAARRAQHGDGEGDPDNPTPPARRRRSRKKAGS